MSTATADRPTAAAPEPKAAGWKETAEAPLDDTPAPRPAGPAAKLVQPTADEYDIGDHEFDDELDATEPVRRKAAAPIPPPAPAPAPAKHQHTARLAKMAADFGMSEDEIAATPPAELDAQVYALHRQMMADREDTRRRYPQTQPATTTQPTTEAPAPVAPPAAPKFDAGLTDDYDPKLVEAINRVHAAAMARIDQLEGEVKQFRQIEANRANETRVQMVDRMFSELNDAHAGVFGKGSRADVGRDTPEFARRLAVLGMAERMEGTDFPAKLKRAAETLFGKGTAPAPASPPPPAKPQPRGTNGRYAEPPDEEEWEAAALARPTHRTNKEPKGTDRATKVVAQKLRDMGEADDDAPLTEESGLPD